MKIGLLKYDHSLLSVIAQNLGDEIQSLAALQFLPRVDKQFNRDTLSKVEADEPYLLIMNGWFFLKPDSFPPSKSILPIFVSLHIADKKESIRHFLSPSSIEYFKKHEPIGCRDRKTMEMLQSKGIEAFYSKCLTITFERRLKSPENGKVFLVDVDWRIPIPRPIRSGAIRVSHLVPPDVSVETKFRLARELLDMYRDEAKLVITTRLHCALPCIAMGIPVIFFGDPTNCRISILKDLGLVINRYVLPKSRILRFLHLIRLFTSALSINWDPDPIDIEAEKDVLCKLVRDRVAQYLI
jgi:hypothetical protein